MPTECKPISFSFQGVRGRRVTAAFDGGSITSNAGALLLRSIDRALGLFDRVAACFTDHRDPRLTEHSVRTLVAQRITGIALGYEDLNDHDELRRDPVLGLLSDKTEVRRRGCAPLAGKSTLNRLEHAPAGGRPGRYRKIDHDPEKLQDVLADLFVESWQACRRSGWCWTSTRPTIRCTAGRRAGSSTTDDPVHGRQEGRFFHGYYGHYCLLPLYILCAGRPLFAQLRPGGADPAGDVTGPLDRVIGRLRREWAWLKVLVRADSAYAREELMAWCRDNGVDYVVGLARNSRLVERIEWMLDDAAAEAERKGRAARGYAEFPYATRKSWSCERRVIAKAEHLADKANPRFVVTSLPADTFSARTVYERLYCRRGDAENVIKGAAAGSLLRPHVGHLLRGQPAAAPLLRLRIGPLRRPQTGAPRHPAGTRHRRNAAAQASQHWSPGHGVGAPRQGRHGLRAPLRRGIRAAMHPGWTASLHLLAL